MNRGTLSFATIKKLGLYSPVTNLRRHAGTSKRCWAVRHQQRDTRTEKMVKNPADGGFGSKLGEEIRKKIQYPKMKDEISKCSENFMKGEMISPGNSTKKGLKGV